MGVYCNDASSQYLSQGNNINPTSQITIMGWLKPIDTSVGVTNVIIQKPYTSHANPYYQYHLEMSWDRYKFYLAIGGSFTGLEPTFVTHPCADGEYHHMAGTYDGSDMKIYFDGVEVGTKSVSGAISTYVTNIVIARYLNQPTLYADCEYEDIRISDTGYSASDIQAIYGGQGNANIIKSLKGRWIGQQKSAGQVITTLPDISGNGNDFSPQNSPTYVASPIRTLK